MSNRLAVGWTAGNSNHWTCQRHYSKTRRNWNNTETRREEENITRFSSCTHLVALSTPGLPLAQRLRKNVRKIARSRTLLGWHHGWHPDCRSTSVKFVQQMLLQTDTGLSVCRWLFLAGNCRSEWSSKLPNNLHYYRRCFVFLCTARPDWQVLTSCCLSVCPSVTSLVKSVLKTNEQILMKIGTSRPRYKAIKPSTLGLTISKSR